MSVSLKSPAAIFWRAASIGSGFAIWYKNLRYMKASGRYGAAVAIGSFIGTLFGYSTGRYIAEQNNAAEIQAYMVVILRHETLDYMSAAI